ncbi:MAG: hypothetical protein KO202_03750 [Methanobacteriaceae archaeon]|jgi:hypothetical protein|nr:hypothetical protein [Methanobacteriaceae archaeon]
MNVKIVDYGYKEDDAYIVYKISGLDLKQLKILDENLNEETKLNEKEKYLDLNIHFEKEFFPFESKESRNKLEDYIAREEIEMEVFISSFLEDFN